LQIHTLKLERVFDIQRYEASRTNPRSTNFSFEAAGRRHYGVRLSGWPRLQAGDTVTAVLASKDNWQTLAGWKNLSTGEKVWPTMANPWRLLHMLWVAGLVYLLTGAATSPAGQQLAFGLRVVLGLVFLSMLTSTWRAWRCRRLIESL